MAGDNDKVIPPSKSTLYKEQTAEEEVDRKVMPWIKRFTLVMLKIVTCIATGLMLAVSVPAVSETIEEVNEHPLQIVVTDEAGEETVEEAGYGQKTASAIGTFFSNVGKNGAKIKDGWFNVSEREKFQRLTIKELEAKLIAKNQELITYKVQVGLDHGTAKSCALVIHDYLREMEGN